MMYTNTYKKNWLKYFIGFLVCFLIRLLPFRPPNIEPLLATQMPFAKAYGSLAGFLFAFVSIGVYDSVTSGLGIWTLITACAYGLLGVWSALYFKNKKNSAWNYVKFAIIGTLAYDLVTGLTLGPLFFHQSFIGALVGQIPFTVLHLLGNISFAAILSPALYSFVIENKKLETASVVSIFINKHA